MDERTRSVVWPSIAAGLVLGAWLLSPVVGLAEAFDLRSPAFSAASTIPAKHTCDGPDRSPPLRWSDPPANTKSLALIVDDPDAPGRTWVHWVVYGIPVAVRELPEGVGDRDTVPGVGSQGVNDFGRVGYGGPCPPRGPAHRYVFTLYALDREVALAPRRSKGQLLEAIEGHVLGRAALTGRYGRR